MNKRFLSYMLLPALLLGSIHSVAQQKKIKINTTESKINWTGNQPGREHKGYVKLSEGELIVEENQIKGGSFIVDMNSITNTDLTNPDAKRKLTTHLKSADFFDVAKYPTAKFVITGVTNQKSPENSDKATHRIEGNLTMKGITKKVAFDASINILNGKFTASTQEFVINRTEWGVNYQSKSIFGDLKDQFIYDDMKISVELVSM